MKNPDKTKKNIQVAALRNALLAEDNRLPSTPRGQRRVAMRAAGVQKKDRRREGVKLAAAANG